MAKKVVGKIKLHIPAGKATPAPPVGPALGQHGVNIMDFCKAFNAKTQKGGGILTPVVITVYQDHSYSFVTKTPPASVLLALAAGRPIVIAGSTMPGEDEQVLAAFGNAGGGEAALLVLAPRHPERWPAVGELLENSDLLSSRRSQFENHRESLRCDVLLLDSLGELASLYGLARAAFIGGTLVSTGGHNPIEPARFGVATAAGPSMGNFAEIAETFDRAGAWQRVATAEDLGAIWRRWIEQPAVASETGRKGAALVESHQGATERTLEILAPILQGNFPKV